MNKQKSVTRIQFFLGKFNDKFLTMKYDNNKLWQNMFNVN